MHLSTRPHLPRPTSPQLADLDARVRALDHLNQLAALAAAVDGEGERGAMPRCRKRDDRNTRPGTTTASEADALVATAADLCARADELAALDAAALAWDGVADASRSDVSDHAATARVAARLQEVSASLNRIAAVDGEDPSRDPRHACAALAGAIASRLAISVDASPSELSVRARARAEEALERYAEAAGADPGSKDKTLRSSAEALRALADSNDSVHLPAHSPVLTEEGRVHHTTMGAAGLTRGAPWLADAYGAWAASHAAMGRELRDGKPNAPQALTPLKDASDGQLTGDRTYVSRWAECAVQAIDVVVEAAEAASKNDSAFDLFATAAADVRATGRLNPNPKPRAVLGPDVLFLLTELSDRTSSAVANWVTHQPRLWPGSRTATHLCVLHSDVCRVDDAMARAARTFESIVNAHPHVGGDRSVSAASASRARVRAALGKATLGVTKSITKTFEDAFKSAAKGTWGGKGYNPKEDIATTSPVATRVCEQMLAPLRLTLKSLDPRTAALVAPTAGASALRGYLARVLAEGKQGVKAKRGGPVRFGLDVEAVIEAAGVETSLAESGGGEVSSGEESGKAATSMKAGNGDGDEEAGAAAAAMDAWRSAARDARAVATLGKGGDAAGLPETEAAAWKKVFV